MQKSSPKGLKKIRKIKHKKGGGQNLVHFIIQGILPVIYQHLCIPCWCRDVAIEEKISFKSQVRIKENSYL